MWGVSDGTNWQTNDQMTDESAPSYFLAELEDKLGGHPFSLSPCLSEALKPPFPAHLLLLAGSA